MGLSDRVADSAVKVKTAELPAESEADTKLPPEIEEEGIVIVAEKAPTLEVVMDAGEVPIATRLYVIVMVDVGANPEPETVTTEPLRPVEGLMDKVGERTVKVEEAELLAESVAVTITSPTGEDEGTEKAVEKDPPAEEVVEAMVDPP